MFELIRSRRLQERYALLWLATGVVLVALSAWRGGLNTIARWFGVSSYPPAILFAVGLLFVILVLLHYSTVISKLSEQNTILAQRLALLESRSPSARPALARNTPGRGARSPATGSLRQAGASPRHLDAVLQMPGGAAFDVFGPTASSRPQAAVTHRAAPPVAAALERRCGRA